MVTECKRVGSCVIDLPLGWCKSCKAPLVTKHKGTSWRCPVDIGHRCSWVRTSKTDSVTFGPFLDSSILWCSDCKRVVTVYIDNGENNEPGDPDNDAPSDM